MAQITFKAFVKKQINQISAEGWPTLRRKLKRLMLLFLVLPLIVLAFSLVILIRLLRPFIIVRIGMVDIGRIGGTYHGDWYMSEKTYGRHRNRCIDWFYFVKSTNHVNGQWAKMWRRVLPVFPWAKLAWYVERLNQWFPGHEKHRIQDLDVMPTSEEHFGYIAGWDLKVYSRYNQYLECILVSSQPNLSFTEGETAYGEKKLRQLGIPPGNLFICFHNRDSAFLDIVKNDFNWRYHDYRDSSIQNYLAAAEEMIKRGSYAIRMGAKVNQKAESADSKVIDYACNGMRSDFLDIYLLAKCKFFLCSNTGISFPSEVFKRPIIYVNWTQPLRVPVYTANGLVIFKKFYLKNENRFMSFLEIMNLEFGGNDTNEIFTRLNLNLIENTPEEIRAVTVEMDERLNGTWQTTEEDEELQKHFWALFGPDKLKSPDLRIGADYLRKHKDLIC